MKNRYTLLSSDFYEPLGEMHEYRVGRYVADIVNEHGITEIQTGNFSALPKKLDAFLRVAPVTLVYPIVHQRKLCYVQASTGEIFSRTRSPKQGQYTDAFWELYQIIPYLFHPQLTLHLLLVDVEEIRLCPSADKPANAAPKKEIASQRDCTGCITATPTRIIWGCCQISRNLSQQKCLHARSNDRKNERDIPSPVAAKWD